MITTMYPTRGLPRTSYVSDSVRKCLFVENDGYNIFRTNLDVIDAFSVVLVADYAVDHNVDRRKIVISELRESYGVDKYYYVFLESFAKSLIESVHESTVNSETGEVLDSIPGRVFVGDDHSLYVCLTNDACIIPVYESRVSAYDYVNDFLEYVDKKTDPIVSSLVDVRVFPAFTEEHFRELVRGKFIPFLEGKFKERAYDKMIESLREEYGFDCKEKGDFTICEYFGDTYHTVDSSGNRVPVRKVVTIKIRTPGTEKKRSFV